MQFIKMELACLGVMAYLTLFFFRSKRPATTANLTCRAMLIAGTVCLGLETVSVFAVNYSRSLPGFLLRLSHQLFFISLCAFLFFACRYVLAAIETKNLLRSNVQTMLPVPMLCGGLLALVLPLYFQTSTAAAYAFGPMTYSYTVCALLYMGVAAFFVFTNQMNAQKRDALLPVILTVAVLALLQVIVPTALLSGMGVALFSLAVVLSMENPAEFLSVDGTLFNRKAFAALAEDTLLRENPVNTVFILYKQMATMEQSFGKDCVDALVQQLRQYLAEVFSLDMYLPLDGCAAVFVTDPKRVDTVVYGLQQRFENEWLVLGVPLNIHADICSYSMPDPYPTVDELIAAAISQSEQEDTEASEIDKKSGVKNKNAFKRALLLLHQNRKAHTSIYYLVADIKNMHQINEEYGYISGDNLLKDCANVLAKAAGEDTEVYRVGGDEFAVLLMSKSDNDIRTLLDRIQAERELRNKESVVPLELSVGYSKYNEDADRSFNSMIARAEFQMNNQKRHMEQEFDPFNTTRLGTKILKQ